MTMMHAHVQMIRMIRMFGINISRLDITCSSIYMPVLCSDVVVRSGALILILYTREQNLK